MVPTTAAFLFTILGYTHFHGVNGFLNMDPNTIFVEMADHSTYEGRVGRIESEDGVPSWMKIGKSENSDNDVFIYTNRVRGDLKHSGFSKVRLHRSTKQPKYGPVPAGTKGPIYVELRLGGTLKRQYYRASMFQEYLPDPQRSIYHLNNKVYIKIQEGAIYMATLQHDVTSDFYRPVLDRNREFGGQKVQNDDTDLETQGQKVNPRSPKVP